MNKEKIKREARNWKMSKEELPNANNKLDTQLQKLKAISGYKKTVDAEPELREVETVILAIATKLTTDTQKLRGSAQIEDIATREIARWTKMLKFISTVLRRRATLRALGLYMGGFEPGFRKAKAEIAKLSAEAS